MKSKIEKVLHLKAKKKKRQNWLRLPQMHLSPLRCVLGHNGERAFLGAHSPCLGEEALAACRLSSLRTVCEEPLPEWGGGSAVKVSVHFCRPQCRATPRGRLALAVFPTGTQQRHRPPRTHAPCQLSCSQLQFSHPECVW